MENEKQMDENKSKVYVVPLASLAALSLLPCECPPIMTKACRRQPHIEFDMRGFVESHSPTNPFNVVSTATATVMPPSAFGWDWDKIGLKPR